MIMAIYLLLVHNLLWVYFFCMFSRSDKDLFLLRLSYMMLAVIHAIYLVYLAEVVKRYDS